MISGPALGQAHLPAFRERHLRSDEHLLGALSGYRGNMFGSGKDAQKNGVLLVTSQRVVFYRKGILGEVLESLPLEKVTSIETSAVMGARRLVIHTSHDSLSFGSMEPKPAFDAIRDMLERKRTPDIAGSSPAQGSVIAATGGPSIAEQLRALTDLHRDHVISDAEFREKREALISRL